MAANQHANIISFGWRAPVFLHLPPQNNQKEKNR